MVQRHFPSTVYTTEECGRGLITFDLPRALQCQANVRTVTIAKEEGKACICYL